MFKKASVRKIIQFLEVEVATNFDITQTSIHVQRMNGHVLDRSIVNDW